MRFLLDIRVALKKQKVHEFNTLKCHLGRNGVTRKNK